MKEIHLIQARHAQPFIKVLQEKGTPIKLLAKQSGLPMRAALTGEGVIGERSLWRFIEYAARRERNKVFGYECASESPVVADGKFGVMPLRREQSLRDLLLQFFEDAQRESSGVNYVIATGKRHSWLRRMPIFRLEQASWQVEQYMIQVFIQIIRICAGPEWVPAEIGVSSRSSPQTLPAEWKNVRFNWGRDVTEIKIPNPMLELAPAWSLCGVSNKGLENSTQLGELTIQALVERQLIAGVANLESTAEELGVSSATLKRKLRAMGSSYSKVLEQCRYEKARDLLINTEVSVREIAHDLGYRHPSNFARAFNRVSGESPMAYRVRVNRKRQ